MVGIRNPGLLAWLHLIRVHSKLQHHSMENLHHYHLTPAQFDVLAHLYAGEGITQQALAEKLLVTKGNVCGLIDRLEKQRLVERRCDPEDKRSNLLYLSDAARKIASEVIPAHEAFIQDHMSVLSDESQRALNALLRELDLALKLHTH